MTVPNQNHSLASLLADLEEDSVLALVKEQLRLGRDPFDIIEECNEGMRVVGQRYEIGEYFISALIMSGEIFREVVEILQPMMVKNIDETSSGRIMVGTVSGDIHDIGKNMLGMLLSCYGFTVYDLGVDVPPAEFAAKAVELKPDIVGLSGLITSSFETMKETIVELRARASANQLSFPILIGGGMMDEQVCQYVGADYWENDAMSGVRLCQKLMQDGRAPLS